MNPDQSFTKLQVDTPSTPPINSGGLSQGELMSRSTNQELQPARSPEVASSRDPEAEPVRDGAGKKEHTSGALQSELNNGTIFKDTVSAQKPIRTGFPLPIIRSQSPSLSDSSDEVIVFAGRGQTAGAHLLNRGFLQEGERGLQRTHSTTNQGVPLRENTTSLTSLAAFRDTSSTGAFNTPRRKPGRRQGLMEKTQLEAQASEEEAIADYIANIDLTDSIPTKNETDAREFTDKEAITLHFGQAEFPKDVKTLEDFDGLGVLNVTEIISKRHNSSGTQYLVVEKDSSAAWISVNYLTSAGAEHHIRAYESRELGNEDGSTSSDNSGGDEIQGQIDADLQDDLDDVLDEKDLWDRRVQGMTDERIARLLSKQEELGLGSSELVLQDGIDEDGMEEDNNAFVVPGKGTSGRARRNAKRSNQFGNNVSYPNTIPEEFDANHYGTFDIMDLNRPSLRRLPKGRSRIATLGLDDDNELESQMQVLWENDRSKKKIRKQEREELRAEGLLGQKSKVNATSEMSSDEIKMAIREFMLSSTPR